MAVKPKAAPAPNITAEEKVRRARHYLQLRHRARTDLLFLVNEILAPPRKPLISREVHGPILDALQKFHGCDEQIDAEHGRLISSKPKVDLWDLEGPRQTMILYPRDSLKTTINTAHKIQWILNYPDIRIGVSTATGTQAESIINALRATFQYSERLRYLFPEYCPRADKSADWGSSEGFTVPNRVVKSLREPTVSSITIGKTISGFHYEILWHSDVVDAVNVETPAQIEKTKKHFHYTEMLLTRQQQKPGWIDIEGTIYDFSDYYQSTIDSEDQLPEGKKQWQIVMKDAEIAPGVSYWPERYPWEELKRIERKVGHVLYSAQYRLKPVAEGQGLAGPKDVVFVSYEIMKTRMEHYRIFTAVDLAGMDPNSTGDFTVFTTLGFDDEGRIDVLDIQRGRWSQDQVVNYFFMCQKRFPRNLAFKIQRDHFVRVLMPMMRREMAKRKQHLRIIEIPIHSGKSKQNRIKALQPWFATRTIRFADEIPCASDLLLEITRFPKFKHDDILDTLALSLENERGEATSEVVPADTMPEWPVNVLPPMVTRFQGFDPMTHQPRWTGDPIDESRYYSRFGL